MKIKIGTLTYKVKYKSRIDIDGPDAKAYLGRVTYENGEIMILKGLRKKFRRQCLWHEIMHVINDQHNLALTEEQLDAMAHGLVGLLEDNRRLV